MRTEGLVGGRDGRRLPGAVFSPEVPSLLPGSRGRGFLTSFVLAPPRPSTRFGSWLVLPGRSRGSEYVCDGPRADCGRGTPARPPPRPLGCGASACPLAGLRVSPVSLTRGGAWLVASQSSSFPCDSADRLGFSLPLQGLRPWFKNGWAPMASVRSGVSAYFTSTPHPRGSPVF